MASNDFNFRVGDLEFIEKSGEDGKLKRIVKGYASTEDEDRQGEVVIQKGLDIDDFKNFGWFNYDHNDDKVLGYPTVAKIDDKGFYVEGELLKGVQKADEVWELAQSLKKCESGRKMGFSIQGKILQRNSSDRTKIEKAKITQVAISPNPVNPSCTWDSFQKSFVGSKEQDSLKSFFAELAHDKGFDIFDTDSEAEFVKSILNPMFKTIKSLTPEMIKALSAGYGTSPSTQTGGGALRSESLEKKKKKSSY